MMNFKENLRVEERLKTLFLRFFFFGWCVIESACKERMRKKAEIRRVSILDGKAICICWYVWLVVFFKFVAGSLSRKTSVIGNIGIDDVRGTSF